jgi:cobalamin synthase
MFGVVLLVGVIYLTYLALLRSDFQSRDLWILSALAIVGSFCSLVAWRLLLNRPRRRDQGLFGPAFLRIGGFIFLLGGGLMAAFDFPYGLLHLLGAAAAATACFALARARTEQDTRWPVDGDVS